MPWTASCFTPDVCVPAHFFLLNRKPILIIATLPTLYNSFSEQAATMVYDPSLYRRRSDRAPNMPQRQESLSTREEEARFDDMIQVVPPKHDSADDVMSNDSYAFLSCSMTSLQLDEGFDLSPSSCSSADDTTTSPQSQDKCKLDSQKTGTAPRQRGGLRRSKGVIMSSPSQRSPCRLDQRSLRSLELQLWD
jgi:hypothetical protein